MAPNRWQAIIWTNADPIHWSIYAAIGGDELTLILPMQGLECPRETKITTMTADALAPDAPTSH